MKLHAVLNEEAMNGRTLTDISNLSPALLRLSYAQREDLSSAGQHIAEWDAVFKDW